ncbi:MAG TPA: hypothetical protein VGR10_02235 [Thermoleophilaceae bacterium]|nr:hypothetical protein [Thermoleophilaceae bacterium]
MQRLRAIETQFQAHRRRLEVAYRDLQSTCADDPDQFSERWRAQAQAWRFDELNELVREHNAWYPAEAKLAMDPRTGDYVSVHGASYRRVELGPEWILERFPATPRSESAPPGRRRTWRSGSRRSD